MQTGTSGNGELVTVRSTATVLATGGLGELYEHTSNPPSARYGNSFIIQALLKAALIAS